MSKFAYLKFVTKSNLYIVKDLDLDLKKLKKIGNRLKKIRLQKNLTQKDLAFLIDVEISQITRIERGIINTSILNIIKISEALEIPLSDFFKDFEL
ncbi:helix-turn-helix domain-containing protein [Chryseobacterium binzhouense]|uniref:helix-turn-helix domain-containing protein n=1 Tax=Chryseobacterium binzhouense TaxID=2593646 RepID=UPI00117FDE37|nr:helix-turn-helix transcriptional regulator [Chryseobacterium binzhouense]